MIKLSVAINALLIMLVLCSSCSYHNYLKTHKSAKDFPYRPFEVYGVDQEHIDKWIIKNHYHKEFYPIDTNNIAITDTSVCCDSVTICIDKDSRIFAPLFTRGIISCYKLSPIYRTLPVWLDEDRKELPQKSKKMFLNRVEPLGYIKTKKTQRILKFRIYRTVFYAELTNESATTRTPINEFIKLAHLTWLYKSPQYVPNM